MFHVQRQSRFKKHPIMLWSAKFIDKMSEVNFVVEKLESNILSAYKVCHFKFAYFFLFYFRGDSVGARKIYPRKVVNEDNENCNFLLQPSSDSHSINEAITWMLDRNAEVLTLKAFLVACQRCYVGGFSPRLQCSFSDQSLRLCTQKFIAHSVSTTLFTLLWWLKVFRFAKLICSRFSC